MNRNQKIILIGIAIVILAMLLYPPFYTSVKWSSHAGYGFILDPSPYKINVSILLVQWLGVIIMGFALILAADDSKNKKPLIDEIKEDAKKITSDLSSANERLSKPSPFGWSFWIQMLVIIIVGKIAGLIGALIAFVILHIISTQLEKRNTAKINE